MTPSRTAADQAKDWLQSHVVVYISFDKALSAVHLLNVALYEYVVDIEIVI